MVRGFASGKRLEHRVARGSSASLFAFVLGILQAVIQVPIYLKYVGVENYGTWLSALATAALIVTPDVGFHTYIGNRIQQSYFKNPPEAWDVIGSAIKFVCTSSVLVIAGLAVVLIYFKAFQVGGVLRFEAIVALLLLQHFSTTSVLGIVIRLYAASGKYATHVVLQSTSRIAQFGVTVIALELNDSLESLLVGHICAGALCNAALLLLARNEFTPLSHVLRMGNLGRGYILWRESLRTSVAAGVEQLSQNGVIILLTVATNSILVAQYSTLKTIVNAIASGLSIVQHPILPEISRLHAERDREKIGEIWKAMYWSQAWVLMSGIIIASLVAPVLYPIWTKSSLPFDSHLFLCLFMALALRSLGAPIALTFHILNRPREQILASVWRILVPFAVITQAPVEHTSVLFCISLPTAEIAALGSLLLVARDANIAGEIGVLPDRRWFLWEIGQLAALMSTLYLSMYPIQQTKYVIILAILLAITTLMARWFILAKDTRSRLKALIRPG